MLQRALPQNRCKKRTRQPNRVLFLSFVKLFGLLFFAALCLLFSLLWLPVSFGAMVLYDLLDKRLVLFTCGLNDPVEPDVKEKLEAQLKEKLGDALDHIMVFHLRGSIRWQSLGLAERLMMKALVADIKKKPEAQRSKTESLLIETEGGVEITCKLNPRLVFNKKVWGFLL